MKVDIITRHAIANYGSLLQAIATQKILHRLGYESEIIDYIREDEHYTNHALTLLKKKPEIAHNPIKKTAYLLLRNFENRASGIKFERERKQLLQMSKRYKSFQELRENPPIADMFMTGSDQVWGPVENGEYDISYCLAFTNKKKIAYAASFGRSEMPERVKKDYQNWLSKYAMISVREDSAVKMLDKWKIKSKQVLDPTLLLKEEDWRAYFKPIKKQRYILIYQIHNDPKLGEYAEKVAKYWGLPLVRISSLFHQFYRPGKFIFCPSIGEFLSYIDNAECLITDSFHGTAFAINFNKQFVEMLPNNETGARNVSILNLTGLSRRVVTDINDVEISKKLINYAPINELLEKERISSVKILGEMLND